MNKHPYNPNDWKYLIPNIEILIKEMEYHHLLSVGITPYSRIIPSFFLNNYSIYTVRRSSDVDILESVVRLFVLEDHHPELAKRVRGTNYLIGNYIFQNFIKTRKPSPTLAFSTTTEKSAKDLNDLNFRWIGNPPETFESVLNKEDFRKTLKDLEVSGILEDTIYFRDEFFTSTFENLQSKCNGPFVVQRADKEVGGNQGTFFIHDKQDFGSCLHSLKDEEGFERLLVTPFVKGHSTSMLGCAMSDGVLAGPLQLQLIDIPESLHGNKPNGIFFGNDLGFSDWDTSKEKEAEEIVKKVGTHLSSLGYRGIFGVDFLYDTEQKKIFANECNPRSTGSLSLYSLSLLESKIPPLEFFHLIAQLDMPSAFDFDIVNEALKHRTNHSHITFSPKGIEKMTMPLLAGVYKYDPSIPTLDYVGPGMSLADLKNENEFLIIDTVPKVDEEIAQGVPRLFKFIFPRSIAKSSHEIDEITGFLIERFSNSLTK